MELKTVMVRNPEAKNFIFGQSHFIKTVEDLHEALVTAVPGIKFGVAFCEASGPCLIRVSGTDAPMQALAAANAEAVGAGHTFFIFLENAFPVNVLHVVRGIPEIAGIFCATANPVEVIVAQSALGRGVLGVIDGSSPKGIEGEKEKAERLAILRKFGYKLGG